MQATDYTAERLPSRLQDEPLSRLHSALIAARLDDDRMFWIVDILLDTLYRETGFKGSAPSQLSKRDDAEKTAEG